MPYEKERVFKSDTNVLALHFETVKDCSLFEKQLDYLGADKSYLHEHMSETFLPLNMQRPIGVAMREINRVSGESENRVILSDNPLELIEAVAGAIEKLKNPMILSGNGGNALSIFRSLVARCVHEGLSPTAKRVYRAMTDRETYPYTSSYSNEKASKLTFAPQSLAPALRFSLTEGLYKQGAETALAELMGKSLSLLCATSFNELVFNYTDPVMQKDFRDWSVENLNCHSFINGERKEFSLTLPPCPFFRPLAREIKYLQDLEKGEISNGYPSR